MNERIDQVIHKLDALMNGAQPGDTAPPPFVPPVLDAMRAVVSELVVDCRTCERFARVTGCTAAASCLVGDLYRPVMFMPLWEMRK